MNSFAGREGEMKAAVLANLQVVVQIFVVKQRRALFAFGPKTFGNFAFPRFGRRHSGLFRERGVGRWRGGRDGRFGGFDAEGFFCEGSSSHSWSLHGDGSWPRD